MLCSNEDRHLPLSELAVMRCVALLFTMVSDTSFRERQSLTAEIVTVWKA